MRDEEYFAIKQRASARLLKIPNVIAVGLGGRERAGQPTGEIVIKVFVARKKPADEVPADELIPASIEGVGTDVIEGGRPRPTAIISGVGNPAAMVSDDANTDPLRGGMSITSDVGDGTLGCFLRDKRDGSAIYGLTNHHVLTGNGKHLSRSQTILQHSATAGLFSTIGIVAGGGLDRHRDAAVVRLERGMDWLPAIKDIGFVTGSHDITLAEAATMTYQVRKRGQRTLLTGGIVTALAVDYLFPSIDSSSISIRPNPDLALDASVQIHFSYFGDSGSAVVNNQNEVVALLWGSDDETSVSARLLHGYAIPIGVVLDSFRRVERLDLEVAVAQNAAPTDTNELKTVPAPAGAPRLTPVQILARSDPGHRRPLIGGSQIMAEPMRGTLNSATLGCVLTEVARPGTGYLLTAYERLTANGAFPPSDDTDVGQPDNYQSISGCCSNTVGEFARAAPAAAPIAAIIKLEDDQPWLAELLEIGPIAGTDAFDAAHINLGIAPVRKYGAGSRLTGGEVIALGGVAGALPAGMAPDAMLIRPNPNPRAPNDPICFSNSVDRGAIVVNSINEAVGLLYDEIDIVDPTSGQTVTHGVAAPIARVLDELKVALGGIELQVGKATVVDDVRTTNNRVAISARAASEQPTPVLRLPAEHAAAAAERLQAELVQSHAGRDLLERWMQHQRELKALIDHNRRVASVWHRNGGPAWLQTLMRATLAPAATIPDQLHGVPASSFLDRLSRILCRYGSPPLQRDLAAVRPVLSGLFGSSFPEFLDSLGRS